MTDREMLKFAAKAAGVEGGGGYYWTPIGEAWNPLTDDGDALRLAVKLRHLRVGLGECIGRGAYSHIEILESGPDPYAATRRAITRAAAEIGKAMP
jgi:hypothetical protein